jgi:predicted peptidase
MFCFISIGVMVANAETITGRIVNGSSAALSNTKIWLKGNPLIFDSTKSDGKFSLSIPSTAISSTSLQKDRTASFKVQNNQLDFSLTTLQHVTAELFNGQGEKVATVFKGMKGAGKNSITVDNRLLTVSGTYVLKFSSEEVGFNAKLISINGRLSAKDYQMAGTSQGFNVSAKMAESSDSLIILRMGYEIKKISLANLSAQDMGDIKLTSRQYKIDKTVAVKNNRTIEVIVPSDLKELYALPVLYLLHGGGEDHTAWRTKGDLLNTLNTFQNKDSMVAMIIVTPDAASNNGYGNYGKTGDQFYTDLTVDIRNYVESNYKVDTSRNARAISGFSMGAMQTHNLTLFYPKLFGYSYPMCGGLYKSFGFSEAKMKSDIASGVIDTAAINSLKAYRLHSNPTDIAWSDTRDFDPFLTSVGIRHTTNFTTNTPGGHTYTYDNEVFRRYAVQIFK